MSPSFPSRRNLICLSLLFQLPFSNVSATSPSSCSNTDEYSGTQCATEYISLINPHLAEPGTDIKVMSAFNTYLHDLPESTYNWYAFWEEQKTTPDVTTKHCNAIEPIPNAVISSTNCLCQLKHVCDDICDEEIQQKWIDTTNTFIYEDPYRIPSELLDDPKEHCIQVLSALTDYESLCSDTDIYKVIELCANGTPNPASPIVSITTPSPTTPSPTAPNDATQSIESNPIHTSDKPTPSPMEELTTQPPSVIDNTAERVQQTTPKPTVADVYGNDTNYVYDNYHYDDYGSHLDIKDLFDTPSTTYEDVMDAISPVDDTDSHPFANLLLVSLIILGFCVFVGWYAKKNQITSVAGGEDDNGYLWGLNKSSSPSEQGIMNAMNNDGKRGRRRHKKLSDFDDDTLDERMKIEMGMNQHNDDLLSITPDHIGRLQTRGASPINEVNNAAMMMKKVKIKKKTKRRGKGGTFEQLNDDDGQNDDDESTGDDSDDEPDMVKMRDQYYASQTFSKKLADTLGDISDTVKVTAAAVKTKLSKKEQTVVVPMQIKAVKHDKKKKKKKMYPFTIVDDNETTDGFDMSDSSHSAQEMEDREEPQTQIRMNIHGRKIKQPMGLPTFNDEDEEDEVQQAVDAVINNKKEKKKKEHKRKKHHHHHKDKDKKRKKKKDKRNKEEMDKDKEESHDINIRINNDDNMGFGTDELNEDDNMDNIEPLTKEEEVMTMNDLQKELMKHNDKEIDNEIAKEHEKQEIVSVDLSFMDSMVDELEKKNVNDNNEKSANDVVGNGSNGVLEK